MSKFQDRVVELIKLGFGDINIKTEVPVEKLFRQYPSGRDRYDIVIRPLHLIVECHGEQHRTLTSFGKQDTGRLVHNFVTQKYRDDRKSQAAIDAGWNYIVIWHSALTGNDDTDVLYIRNTIGKAMGLEEI